MQPDIPSAYVQIDIRSTDDRQFGGRYVLDTAVYDAGQAGIRLQLVDVIDPYRKASVLIGIGVLGPVVGQLVDAIAKVQLTPTTPASQI